MRVLVTAVGAVIGYGIVRSLRRLTPSPYIVGTDIFPDAVGQAWCDKFVRVPLTADPAYAEALESLLRRHRVELILPGVEHDVNWLDTQREWLDSLGVKTALNTPRVIALGRDKWATHEFLAEHGIPTIPTMLPDTFEAAADRFGVPFLLKARDLSSGKGISFVETKAQFVAGLAHGNKSLMAQQLVGTDDREYTVGIFGMGQGDLAGWITMRRRLNRDGATAKAWVVADPEIDREIVRLCGALEPVGPTNLQFRHHDGRYLLLEINPRFSSSTSLRALFGFNEAEMSVAFFGQGRAPDVPVIRSGHAVRYLEDMVVS